MAGGAASLSKVRGWAKVGEGGRPNNKDHGSEARARARAVLGGNNDARY